MALIPEETVQCLRETAEELTQLEQHFEALTGLLNPSTLALLQPLDRASIFLSVAKMVNTLFTLHLRFQGLSPDEQSTKSEQERLNLYEEKLSHFTDSLQAPRYPTSTLDVQAANRFIEHAIPDLTEEQKKSIRNVSKEVSEKNLGPGRLKVWFDRPARQAMTQSISEAAAEFLMEAKKELLEAQENAAQNG